MTMDSGHHEAPASAGPGWSMATSSTGLWREILERLREVQESQAKLADAIEVLGLMVQDALASDDPSPPAAPDTEAAVDPPRPHDALSSAPVDPPPEGFVAPAEQEPHWRPGWGPEAPVKTVEEVAPGFKDSAPPADSVITSVEAPAPRAWSGAAEVREQAVETGVPEPVFFVPSFDEEVLPATSVAELSASALDAALETEFRPAMTGASLPVPPAGAPIEQPSGPSSDVPHVDTRQLPGPSVQRAPTESVSTESMSNESVSADSVAAGPAPTRVAVTAEHTKVLDILLGTPRTAEDAQLHIDAQAMSSSTASNTSPSHLATPALQSSFVMASPPPPPPPPPPADVPVHEAQPTSVVTPARDVLTPPPDVAPPLALDTEAAPVAAPLPPPPPQPVFVAQDQPVAAPAPLAPPPPPPPPSVDQPDAVAFTITEVPTANLSAYSLPPNERGFEIQGNGTDPLSAFDGNEGEPVFTTDESHQLNSVASMATEILAVAPEASATGVPEELSESELISKDVTLIARGRKKRFRLH